MFPELRDRFRGAVKEFRSSLDGTGTPTLGLKGAPGFFGLDDVAAAQLFRSDGFKGIANALLSGGGSSWTGEQVNQGTASSLSAFWACWRTISQTMGSLPCVMMQKLPDGSRRTVTEKPLAAALLHEANPEMTAQSFIETATSHAVLRGTGFAKPTRRSSTGEALELYPISPTRIHRDRNKIGQLVWIVDGDGTYTVEPGKPHDILTVPGFSDDGIQGHSVLAVARQSMGIALSAERNVASFYSHGGRSPYILEQAQKFASPLDEERFRTKFEEAYNNPHRVPMVPPGLKWISSGMSLVDQQLLESRQWTVLEICRWFGLSPHIAGDLSKATFANIEQLFLEFKALTIMPWATRWAESLRRCVLTPEEKLQNYYFAFDFDRLDVAESAARMNGFATGLQNGILNIDEARQKLEMNALPNGAGKAVHLQVNMQTLPGTGEPLQPAQPSESPNSKPINQPRAA